MQAIKSASIPLTVPDSMRWKPLWLCAGAALTAGR
jgi:hypothetical protein